MSGAARRATAPLRQFFNQHFEMVKTEVRSAAADEGEHTRQAVAELGQAVGELSAQVAELERTVNRLADVVAAMTLVPDPASQSGS